jgi:hypothetical protein
MKNTTRFIARAVWEDVKSVPLLVTIGVVVFLAMIGTAVVIEALR